MNGPVALWPATAEQVRHCKELFKKDALFSALDDEHLVIEVKAVTGFDLANLTRGDVKAIVAKFRVEAAPTVATPAQVEYCKDLFRKVKLYYRCLDDDNLIAEVRTRTGFDLNALTYGDVQSIIDKLKPEAQEQRRGWTVDTMKLSDAQQDMLERVNRHPVRFVECDGTQMRTLTALEKKGLVEEKPTMFNGVDGIVAYTVTDAGRNQLGIAPIAATPNSTEGARN